MVRKGEHMTMTSCPKTAVDADFEEIDVHEELLKKKKQEALERMKNKENLPATLKTFSLLRHELKAGQTNETIVEIAKELDVDKELGLKKQAEFTISKSLEHDIDELTSSKDYFEVSQDLLKKLFQISKLRQQCFWHNFFTPIKAFIKAGALPLFIHGIFLMLLYPMAKFSAWISIVIKAPTPGLITLCVFNVIGWLGVLVALFFGFFTWGGRKIKYAIMKVGLKSSPLDEVNEKIPYGAKLKVLEAHKTGIFKDFVYISPEFKTDDKEHKISFPSVDPAILGVTGDKRMYMIVYWDIENDVEKIVKQIEHFKKFKLQKS